MVMSTTSDQMEQATDRRMAQARIMTLDSVRAFCESQLNDINRREGWTRGARRVKEAGKREAFRDVLALIDRLSDLHREGGAERQKEKTDALLAQLDRLRV